MSAEQPIETWKDVEEFPGYQVSDLGRVRSRRLRGRLGTDWHLLRGSNRGSRPYWKVGLVRGGRTHHVTIHALVLTAFVGPCPEGMQGCHKDDDKNNNRLTNLRWGTPKSNSADRVRNGRQIAKETHHKAKITEDDVTYIRAVAGRTKTLQEVADELGLTKGHVWKIKAGRHWC